jgi:hypothetical protein
MQEEMITLLDQEHAYGKSSLHLDDEIRKTVGLHETVFESLPRCLRFVQIRERLPVARVVILQVHPSWNMLQRCSLPGCTRLLDSYRPCANPDLDLSQVGIVHDAPRHPHRSTRSVFVPAAITFFAPTDHLYRPDHQSVHPDEPDHQSVHPDEPAHQSVHPDGQGTLYAEIGHDEEPVSFCRSCINKQRFACIAFGAAARRLADACAAVTRLHLIGSLCVSNTRRRSALHSGNG